MELLPKAFEAMASHSQFIIYVLKPSNTRPGKSDKFPINHRTGAIANAHDPSIWMSASEAIITAKKFGEGYGVGFVFTKYDPFWFLDIDNCLLDSGTEWSDLARSLLLTFNGAAVEVSASGRGLHIFGCGKVPEHACKNISYQLEFYSSGRFVALTGNQAVGDSGFDASHLLPWLVENYFPPQTNSSSSSMGWTDSPAPGWNGNTDDHELLIRMLRSQSSASVFGHKASFRDLWERNVEALRIAYPDPTRENGYDESSADAGLAQHLAFWTGNDCERIQRLMLQSALNRDKWDRKNYLPRTILGACGRQNNFLIDKPTQFSATENVNQEGAPKPSIRTGATFLNPQQQIELFEGCVYVRDEHKILIPGGHSLKPEQFKAVYGGYTMVMDHTNTKTTRNAFEAFVESQAIEAPRVDSTCFKPNLAPGSIILKEGSRLVNTYFPVVTPRMVGDVTLFLRHIEKLCPDPVDQIILISYLAACVQHKGIKFQYCPLIQGVEGNGKTLLTRCVAFAIGDRYSHFPKAAELVSKFNDWLYRRIFIGVEDIYVPDHKAEIMEGLKPMITGDRLEIEPKGGEKITRDICANFLLNTNHKDGLRKNKNDRRFAIFYTAQQNREDILRDGMGGDYFAVLYRWLSKADGYAMVAHFLECFMIPDEYNPAHGMWAPRTSSTDAAIEQGQGGVEQEVMEQIEQGVVGFKNGWVSSMALDLFLKQIGAARRIPLNKRREFMQSLGYDWHPTLRDGRVNNVIQPDGGKPRLYIRIGHEHLKLTGAGEVAKAYTDDQLNKSS